MAADRGGFPERRFAGALLAAGGVASAVARAISPSADPRSTRRRSSSWMASSAFAAGFLLVSVASEEAGGRGLVAIILVSLLIPPSCSCMSEFGQLPLEGIET